MINPYKYQIINPIRDKSKPYYDSKTGILHFKCKTKYRYYVEACINTENKKELLFLLGTEKFDNNCKSCEVNMYNNCKIKLSKEIKEYVEEELKYRQNIEVNYKETEDNFDVFVIE